MHHRGLRCATSASRTAALPWVASLPWAAAVLWGATAAAAQPSTPVPAGDGYMSYSGTATARRSGDFLYGEHHLLAYRAGRLAERVVLYTCRDGSAFARKTVSYVDLVAPDFLLDDTAGGMREGIRSAGGTRTVFYQGDRTGPERSKPLPTIPGLVADAGFDEFIRAHWRALTAGQTLQLHFLVPSRLAAVNFKLERLRGDSLNGVAVDVFRLKLSGLLGDVLPSIDVSYVSADHVLLRYEGLSDLRDRSGDNFQAQIDFPESERAPADAPALAAARSAPLAACR